MPEDIELLIAKDVLLRIDLNTSGLVFDVDEHALAHVPMRCDTPSQSHFASLSVVRLRLRAFFRGAKPVPERIDPALPQCLQLRLPLLNQRIRLFHKEPPC